MTENPGKNSQNAPNASPLAKAARELVRNSQQGTLCTLTTEGGFPYGSLVELFPLPDGDVVMFLSGLAEHQRFLAADPRASVLIAPHMHEPNVLTQPRVTLVGRATVVAKTDELTNAYLRLHPGTRTFMGFGDFQFYRLHVERARYIAGFGQMGWVMGDAYRAVEIA